MDKQKNTDANSTSNTALNSVTTFRDPSGQHTGQISFENGYFNITGVPLDRLKFNGDAIAGDPLPIAGDDAYLNKALDRNTM